MILIYVSGYNVMTLTSTRGSHSAGFQNFTVRARTNFISPTVIRTILLNSKMVQNSKRKSKMVQIQ